MTARADPNDLLLEAFRLPPAQALEKWKAWRAGRNLDHLQPSDVRLLPLLAHRLEEWLADDDGKAVIQGVLKRAWTRNQLAYRLLAGVVHTLRSAGVDRMVLIGPGAWALLYAERKSIRPADWPELLVARDDAMRSAKALVADGWRLLPGYPQPTGDALNRGHNVWFENDRDERFGLAWRLAPCAPELAPSREKLGPLEPADIQGAALHRLGTEQTLLDMTAGYRDHSAPDWRWDALALIETRTVDWTGVGRYLGDDDGARLRLRQLHQAWGVSIPARVLDANPGWFRRRLSGVWRDYLWHSRQADRPPSWIGFALYCPKRWWKVFVTNRVSI